MCPWLVNNNIALGCYCKVTERLLLPLTDYAGYLVTEIKSSSFSQSSII